MLSDLFSNLMNDIGFQHQFNDWFILNDQLIESTKDSTVVDKERA